MTTEVRLTTRQARLATSIAHRLWVKHGKPDVDYRYPGTVGKGHYQNNTDEVIRELIAAGYKITRDSKT